MKKKNKISEMVSYKDTSKTTSSVQNSTSSSSGNKGGVTVNADALKNQEVVKAIDDLEKSKIPIQVVEETLEYLSEVKDIKSGNLSKPFTINGKKYQMVRAITPKKEKVMGVYSFNEVDDRGLNKIYGIKEFEKNIAQKFLKENIPHNDEGINDVNPTGSSDQNKNDKAPNFEGYKHFIVNNKTGKARKFKSIEELAKAKMDENEKYMSVKEFRKYVDEALFGSGKKNIVSEVGLSGGETDEDMNVKAQKLMKMIQKRIPEGIIDQIKTNKIAQREVIAAFAEMIGVPRNGLSQLITGLKQLSRSKTNFNQQGTQPVKENRKAIKKLK
jgi:hypothetical protein